MEKITNQIKEMKLGNCFENESMKFHTTMRIGGTVSLLVVPNGIEELQKIIRLAKQERTKYFIIGKGSNLIFSDEHLDLLVIKITATVDRFEHINNTITVGAGYSLTKLAKETSKAGLSGLEFAGGIPGTVGGAVYMNAGAHLAQMSNVISQVKVLEGEEIKIYTNEMCEFDYRHSIFCNSKTIILEATMELTRGSKSLIFKQMAGNLEYRKEYQPLEFSSCGSTFRNPKNNYAGKLIEDCGLKGVTIGGAKVSEKHANFIINVSSATCKDVIELVDLIKKKVMSKHGIDLLIEAEFIGVNYE